MKILKGAASPRRRTTCLFYQPWYTRVHGAHSRTGRTHAHTRLLYGRPPLHCVNTIRSLRPDLDYLESTCNAHIRSAEGADVTMAPTCPPGPTRDTPKKITILKKQRPLASIYLIILSPQLTLLKGGLVFQPIRYWREGIVCLRRGPIVVPSRS